jgi:hypothetical protein
MFAALNTWARLKAAASCLMWGARGHTPALHVTGRPSSMLMHDLLGGDQAPRPPKWKALPGQVIELGATGFQIVMDTGPNNPLYMLRAPEGWPIHSGVDLPTLKQLGERFAAEREEFVCKPEVQKW